MTTACHVTQTPPTFSRSKIAAIVKLRGSTQRAIARNAGVSIRHLFYVLDGKRPLSRKVAAALRDALGDEGWRWATGQIGTLTDVPPASEVPPCST